MPKCNGEGKAQTLTPAQFDDLMELLSPKLRGVLSVCRYTACRHSEALGLTWANVLTDHIVIPKSCTKGKKHSREIPLAPPLAQELALWRKAWIEEFHREPAKTDFLFPGEKRIDERYRRQSVDHGLRVACAKIGIEGASTHSFRRSALSLASNRGVPLRQIQEISGHTSLGRVG